MTALKLLALLAVSIMTLLFISIFFCLMVEKFIQSFPYFAS